uniref:Uncharacterized protein n=1 Tax=virus sp. ctBM815 TaxID=2825806 RepID=A0A8S5RK67_9VIRU|nr:MAG TPA: hypothetical protein [virus sp. ctBM815]DAV23987.1 MAG TPA: hypothetical protein [Bacteriophage sp.]
MSLPDELCLRLYFVYSVATISPRSFTFYL